MYDRGKRRSTASLSQLHHEERCRRLGRDRVLPRVKKPRKGTCEPYRLHGGKIWEIAQETGIKPKELLDFSANINPLGPSPKAISAIRDSLWRLPHYPEPDSTTLRQRIAKRFSTTLDSVIVGNGSTEIIHLFAEARLQRKGKIIIPQPTFAEYEAATRRFGGQTRLVFARPRAFSLPLDEIDSEMGAKTKAVFICNPNNPTGELIERKRIVETVERAGKKNIPVLIDETFIEFSEKEQDSTLVPLAPDSPNLIVLRSLTKMYALTGLRVGYAIGYRGIIRSILKRKEPWNINCLAEAATLASLGDEDYVKRTKELTRRERQFLQTQLSQIQGLESFPSDTNFLLVCTKETKRTSHEIQSNLLKKGIIVRDCSSFRGLDHFFIRVAVKKRAQNKRLIAALSEILE